jgi:CheY-like chemotaxis protein
VLVADDEPQVLRLVERLLERAGYTVVSARDGDEALRALASHAERIQVAVLDAAILPRGCREILEAIGEATSGIGVVVSSGDVLDHDVERLLRECGGVFLRKPYAPNQLIHAVEGV